MLSLSAFDPAAGFDPFDIISLTRACAASLPACAPVRADSQPGGTVVRSECFHAGRFRSEWMDMADTRILFIQRGSPYCQSPPVAQPGGDNKGWA
eukprot:8216885-Pyramimonas_sp.AAC.3